jgi:hypothetical protein
LPPLASNNEYDSKQNEYDSYRYRHEHQGEGDGEGSEGDDGKS